MLVGNFKELNVVVSKFRRAKCLEQFFGSEVVKNWGAGPRRNGAWSLINV
jgi:hypothetical protein